MGSSAASIDGGQDHDGAKDQDRERVGRLDDQDVHHQPRQKAGRRFSAPGASALSLGRPSLSKVAGDETRNGPQHPTVALYLETSASPRSRPGSGAQRVGREGTNFSLQKELMKPPGVGEATEKMLKQLRRPRPEVQMRITNSLAIFAVAKARVGKAPGLPI